MTHNAQIMDDYIKLIAKMEDAANKTLRYIKLSTLLYDLQIVLFISAVLAIVAYVLFHGAYWQLAFASIALAIISFVTSKLGNRYYREAFKEIDRLKKLAHTLALATKIDQLTTKLEKEIDELEREFKRLGIQPTN